MSKTKIILADQHQIIRQGICALLHSQPGFEVVAETADISELMDGIKAYRPNMVIVDTIRPNLDGAEATKNILASFPDMHVIILAGFASRLKIMEGIRNGARGYVSKYDDFSEVLKAVENVSGGGYYLSPQISDDVVEILQTPDNLFKKPISRLTRREIQILQQIATGDTSQVVADKLHISKRTVDRHRLNIKDKLDLHNQTELVHFAIQESVDSLN